MSAIDWDRDFEEPWRSIGREWCEQLFAIANGGVPRPPTVSRIWDGGKFKERLQYYRIKQIDAAKYLQVGPEQVSRWSRGEVAPTKGRQVAIEAMFAEAENKQQ